MILFFTFIAIILAEAYIIFSGGNTSPSRKLFLWICGIELFAVIGLRSVNMGTDTITYYNVYLTALHFPNLEIFASMENFYLVFNKVLGIISPSPHFLFIVCAAFIVISFSKLVYRNKDYVWLSVIIFICLDQMAFHMAAMRQSIAIGFVFFSYKYIIERKLALFLLLILSGSLFHSSAVIFAPVYFLSYVRLNLKIVFLFIAVGIAGYLFFDVVNVWFFRLLPTYVFYQESFYFFRDVKLASYMKFFICLCIFVFSYAVYVLNKNNIPKNSDFKMKVFISLLACVFMFISAKATILERAGYYFSFFNVIALPSAIKMIKNANMRIAVIAVVLILCFIYAYIVITFRPEWWRIIPYEFLWKTYKMN